MTENEEPAILPGSYDYVWKGKYMYKLYVLFSTFTLILLYNRQICIYILVYRKNSKYCYIYFWTNCVDSDQAAAWSRSTLFAILSTSFGGITAM